MNAPPRARRRCVYVCERELALLFIITRIAKNIAKFRFLPGNGLDLHTLFFSRSHPALRWATPVKKAFLKQLWRC